MIVPKVAPPTEDEALCGEKCGDPGLCSSFASRSAEPLVDLEAACNSRCIPEFALASCAACNGDGKDGNDSDADADADAVITAEQRFGGFFSAPPPP